MKKLSIITINYNDLDVEKTCESIVNQTWQDFEWIIIDGGSNKKIQNIYEKYKSRIDIFISESDTGIYNAYNKGIKLATGKYLNFMNAGDLFYTNETLLLFNAFSENNNADIYYGEYEFMPNISRDQKYSHMPKVLDSSFLIMDNINTQSAFVRKELFNTFGSFDETYKIAADYEKWCRFFKAGVSFKYLPIIIASYNQDGISTNKKGHHLLAEEGNNTRFKYFSREELEQVNSQNPLKYSLLQKIFSIKTTPSKTHKIVTILGIHITIKRKIK